MALSSEERQRIKDEAREKARKKKDGVKRAKKLKTVGQLVTMPVYDKNNPEQFAKDDLNALQQGFRDRVNAESERFQQATDTEFWFAVCFQTRAQKEAFLKNAELFEHGDKYLDGAFVAEKFGVQIPDESVKYRPSGKVDKTWNEFVK